MPAPNRAAEQESLRVENSPFPGGHLLGSGATGDVFLATSNPTTNDRVAIKVIKNPETSVDRALKINERAEIEKQASGLQHKNIVKYLGSGNLPDGRTLLVMEYLEGRDLKEVMEAHDPLSNPIINEERAINWMIQTLEGLQAAHNHVNSAGQPEPIVHRDIKPANIMLTQEDVIKILDFGLLKSFPVDSEQQVELTKTGTIVGTPSFFAPENGLFSLITTKGRLDQIERAEWSIRQEIYSAGNLFYRLLAIGKTPYDTLTHGYGQVVIGIDEKSPLLQAFIEKRMTLDQLLQAAIEARQTPLPELQQHRIRPEVFEIVKKFVAIDPRDRFQNTAEALAALRALTREAQPVPVPPAEPNAQPVDGVTKAEGQQAKEPVTADDLVFNEMPEPSAAAAAAASPQLQQILRQLESQDAVIVARDIGNGTHPNILDLSEADLEQLATALNIAQGNLIRSPNIDLKRAISFAFEMVSAQISPEDTNS